MEGLERFFACMLSRDALKMDATGFTAALTLDSSTGAAADSLRFDIALCDLVPPLLLSGSPDLLSLAVNAGEWSVDIVAAGDKFRNTVAVRRRQEERIAGGSACVFTGSDDEIARISRCPCHACDCALLAMGQDLGASLLVALHETSALTFDMSGGWKRAKHAGRRPLDGRVRAHSGEAERHCLLDRARRTPGCRETPTDGPRG